MPPDDREIWSENIDRDHEYWREDVGQYIQVLVWFGYKEGPMRLLAHFFGAGAWLNAGRFMDEAVYAKRDGLQV